LTDTMNTRLPTTRALAAIAAAVGLILALPAPASAHARVSPAVSLKGQLQLYSLAVPTEKENLTTSKVVMTVPDGFGIDSFAPAPPGWHRQVQQTGSGESAVVTTVTWTGGHTPTGEDSVFEFLAQPDSAKTYTFGVKQTYSDGSIVNWTGAENADDPAPTIEVKSSLGDGSSTGVLPIVALIVAVLALLAAGLALVGGRGGGGGGDPDGSPRPPRKRALA
jgi:uncharacterized protein YcnI